MKTPKSIRARCLESGKTLVEYNRIMKRISRGIDEDEAFELESYGKKEVVDHNGNVYKNKKEMLEHYGVPASTFNSRIKANWSLKDALKNETKQQDTD